MDQRLGSSWRMSINEKQFIEEALTVGLRVDGRGLLDFRQLSIKFGREDGSVEVHLGQTHVMGCVTAQLAQPYRDRPNEGSLAIFTEFSPMADPSFEPGRPGESAIELGRVIDRGLRESRAVDTESLCVISGKFVWALRVDLHILDNCGNLIDAANIAALAALLTFRRPECTLVGEDSQEVVIHPPEVREPLPLVVHHLPIAVTFAIFSEGIMVIDPTHHEEAVMGGRMIVTMNTNNELCAIQKAGGEGVVPSSIGDCLRIASIKVADITSKIKKAVELYDNERTLRKVKHHSTLKAVEVNIQDFSLSERHVDKLSSRRSSDNDPEQSRGKADLGGSRPGPVCKENDPNSHKAPAFIGAASNWDPYDKVVSSDLLSPSLISPGLTHVAMEEVVENTKQKSEVSIEESSMNIDAVSTPADSGVLPKASNPKSLKDAVKPKHKRKKKGPSTNGDK